MTPFISTQNHTFVGQENFCVAKIKYIMYNVQDYIILFAAHSAIYVRVGILLTYEKHLHDRIISLRGEIWVHKTSLTPSFTKRGGAHKTSLTPSFH